jgi:hypothetical protein
MQWKVFPTMILVFTGLNGTGTGSSQNLHSSTGTLALGTPGIPSWCFSPGNANWLANCRPA